MAFFDETRIKNELLTKYHKLPSTLASGEPCFAISSDWWLTFKFILDETLINPEILAGHPGPINNISILKIDEDLKKAMLQNICGEGAADANINELTDWNRMKMKPKLSYTKDFIIVSSKVWKFLHDLFGGGPEIPFLIENVENSSNTERLITIYEESNLDFDYCINLKLKTVNIVLDQDTTKMTTFRVSLGVSAKNFLQFVCSKLKIPFVQAKFSYWKDADGTNCQLLNFSDFDTLARLGIKKNAIISVSKESPEANQSSAPVSIQTKRSENAEGNNNYQDDGDDNMISILNDDINPDRHFQVNEFWTNSDDPLGVRENDTSTKTDSTGLPNQNSVIIEDIPIEEIAMDNRYGGPRIDITTERVKVSKATINALQAKIQKVVSEEKIQLRHKPLKDIKKSLSKIQAQWFQQNNPKAASKF